MRTLIEDRDEALARRRYLEVKLVDVEARVAMLNERVAELDKALRAVLAQSPPIHQGEPFYNETLQRAWAVLR